MKQIVLAVLLLVARAFSCQNPDKINVSFACSYFGEELSNEISFIASNNEAQQIINDIIAVIGLKPRFEIRAANIPNAAAVIHQNKRYVLYNPDFIKTLNEQVGNRWASVSILAHEIGHHLNGHTLDQGGSRPDIELEADEFSGFVVRKLGATLAEAQGAMRIAASVKASHTHPAKNDRLEAIARGWNVAQEQIAGGKSPKSNPDVVKPEVATANKKPQALIADKFIAYDAQFDSDPKGIYHVTIRNNLVTIKDDQLYIVGRLAESNRKEYPMMLYDQHYNYLYITKKGNIINGSGQQVGRLRKHS